LVVQRGHSQPITRLLFSPDGKLLLTGDRENDVLWETGTGREVRRWQTPETVVDFSPDSKTLLTRERNATPAWTVRIRDVGTAKVLRSFSGTAEELTYAHFSKDGKQVITLSDGRLRREWDIETGKVTRHVTSPLASSQTLQVRCRLASVRSTEPREQLILVGEAAEGTSLEVPRGVTICRDRTPGTRDVWSA